jgi:Zn-dependent protease with chaperone function
MKTDLNIFATFFVIKIALLIGFYRLFSGYLIDQKIFGYVFRKFKTFSQCRNLTWLFSTMILCAPFPAVNYAVDLIWLLFYGKWSAGNASSLLSWNLNKSWYFLLFFGLPFIMIHKAAKRCLWQRRAGALVTLGAMAIMFTLVEQQVGKFNTSPARMDLPAGSVRSGIEKFLDGTIYSAVALQLTSHPSKNAAAGSGGILVTSALVESLDGEALNSIIAHEIGHMYHRDDVFYALLLAGLLVTPLTFYAGCGIWNRIRRRVIAPRKPTFTITPSVAAMIFLAFILPARVLWSQLIRLSEYDADSYAVACLHAKQIEPQIFIDALAKVSPELSNPTTATYLLFYDHPTQEQRAENIMNTYRLLNKSSAAQ